MAEATESVVKRSIRFLLGMNALMLGANLVWISYNSILLPTLIEKVVTERKGLVVGLLGFFGTLLGLLVSIVWGIISDHTSSKLGKRTPAILASALVSLPFICLPALILAPSAQARFFSLVLPVIIISYMGMQFFTNMGNGAWWPLLVDIVDEKQRGLASGIQGFFTLLGSAVGIVVVTSLNEAGQTEAALWMIAFIFAVTGLVNAWVIRGKDKPAEKSQPFGIWDALSDMFKVRRKVVVFFWMVLALLLANMGINSLMFFARYFFQYNFPAINPDEAFRMMGGISLLVTILSAIGSGLLSDKVGRRSMILWSMFACALFTVAMGFTTSFNFFLLLTALRSIAMGPILATAPALASDLSPKEEAGRYMAYNNLSTGFSAGLASLIFGILLVNMTRTAFMYVFIISSILFFAGGLVFAIKVTEDELVASFEAAGEVGGIP